MKTRLYPAILLLSLSTGCGGLAPFQGLDSRSGAGTSARAFLAADPYPKLVVEVQAVQGFAPTAAALNGLKSFLEARLNKPAGIAIVVDPEIPSPGGGPYTIEDVRRIEDAHRLSHAEGSSIAAYFLFLDGSSASDEGSSRVLGQAHHSTSMVIYEGTIRSLSGGLGQPSTAVAETTVLSHEFGHILGLVNAGTSLTSAHQDSDHGAHCTNPQCLMHWSVETGDFLSNLLGGSVPALDAACLQDLRGNGGK